MSETIEATLGDAAEAAYWRFDARRKGYAEWKGVPMSERDAFKAEFRSALTRAAEGRWVKPGVCLKLCSAHQGMTYSFTVMSAPPVPEVCPICHPEALPTPPTD